MNIRLLSTVVLVLFFFGCAPPKGIYHEVRAGQTLYRIGKTYQVDEAYIARINGISDPSRLRTGQKLYIPGVSTPRKVPVTAARKAPAPPRAKKAATTRARSTVKASPPKKRAPSVRPPRTTSKPPKAQKGLFIYPVAGKVVKKFGQKSGQINRGIEIAAPLNAPVVAAAPGRIIYSGNEISGYGNLIIIKHDNSYYTVYGFSKKNYVTSGSYVGRGDKIAACGTPPSGGKPRLHFEIRHGKEAVNPIFYLP